MKTREKLQQEFDNNYQFYIKIIESLVKTFITCTIEVCASFQDIFDETICEHLADIFDTFSKKEVWLNNEQAKLECRNEAIKILNDYIEDIDFNFDLSSNVRNISNAILEAFKYNIQDSINDCVIAAVNEAIENNRHDYGYSDFDFDDRDPSEVNMKSDNDASNKVYLIKNELCEKGKCLTCFEICPQKAIVFKNGNVMINQSRCNSCGICKVKCNCNAIDDINIDSIKSWKNDK